MNYKKVAGLFNSKYILGSNVTWVIASTAIKMLYGLLLYKFIAVTYGIATLGTVGQLLSTLSILLILSNAGIGRGIIQTFSRHQDNQNKIHLINQAALYIAATCSIILSIVLIFAAGKISEIIFGTNEYETVIYVIAASALFMGINSNIISIGIAKSKSKLVSQASIYTLLISMLLVVLFGNIGYKFLLSVICLQAMILFLFLLITNRNEIISHLSGFYNYSAEAFHEVQNYLKFSFAIITPVLLMQISLIINRNNIFDGFGSFNLGLWESVIKLEEGYIQFVAVLLIYFMLPQASASPSSSFKIAKKYMGYISITLLIVFFATYLFGGQILRLVYNNDAMQVEYGLITVTMADVLKSAYIVNQYLILSLAKIKLFITLEVLAHVSSVSYIWFVTEYSTFDWLFKGYLILSFLLTIISLGVVKSLQTK